MLQHIFIDLYFRFIMKVYNILTNTKVNYLNAPDYIVSDKLKYRFMMFFHLLPTFVLSIILTVKILPLFSDEIHQKLDRNSTDMLIYEIINWILISTLLGFLIENFLELTNLNYKELKEN